MGVAVFAKRAVDWGADCSARYGKPRGPVGHFAVCNGGLELGVFACGAK